MTGLLKKIFTKKKKRTTSQLLKIYLKWYSDIPKIHFYKVLALDPTTIFRGRTPVKMGTYSKWLLIQYRQKEMKCFLPTNENSYVKSYETLKEELHRNINAHRWYKRNIKKLKNYIRTEIPIDIMKMDSVEYFLNKAYSITSDYRLHLENIKLDKKGKVFLIYEDENLKILEPLNYAACYKYSKYSEWCSKTENSYDSWSNGNILLRFINKKTKEICRLTWNYSQITQWSWAMPIYPEFRCSEICYHQESIPIMLKNFRQTLVKGEYTSEDSHNETAKRYEMLYRMFQLITEEAQEALLNRYKTRAEEYREKEHIAAEERLKKIQEHERILESNYNMTPMYMYN